MAADPRRGPTSFRDPTYDALDRSVEDRLKLPPGMLAGIRTRGERSNSDQVSSAGARTVYQVTPTTRDLVMNKYGVDAYAGPQQAALAAGYLLREGLDRNRGSQRAAIAEYHGGTNRRNHGPITQAYVSRVAGGDGTSTYDRARAKQVAAREEQSGPSLAKVYAAYRQGRMSTEQAAQFEHDVNAGAILLPPGGKLKRTPAAPQLPAGVVRAYNDLESGMTVEQRQQIDRDMRDGVVSLPRAAKLNTWRPMTTGENMWRSAGVGMRAVIEGAGDVAGIVMNPVNSMLNATGLPQTVTGQALPMANDPSVNVADKLGLPKAQFDGEKMLSSVERGAAGSLFSAGAGGIVKSLPGVAGAVGRAMAASPAADAVAGGVSGGSAEAARQGGLGPTGQFVAGLAGGGIGSVGASVAGRAVTRIGRGRSNLDMPATTPREVIVNQAGDLTEDGQELVARHGFTPDEIKQAYAEPTASSGAARSAEPEKAQFPLPAQVEPMRQSRLLRRMSAVTRGSTTQSN